MPFGWIGGVIPYLVALCNNNIYFFMVFLCFNKKFS
jgi:hypothetical protein